MAREYKFHEAAYYHPVAGLFTLQPNCKHCVCGYISRNGSEWQPADGICDKTTGLPCTPWGEWMVKA